MAAAAAATNAPTRSLSLPEFHRKLLNEDWTAQRATSGKLNVALYSVRATLAGMCGMHVAKMPTMKKHQCWREVLKVYLDLVTAFRDRYPDAAVNEFIGHTSTTKITPMDGEKVWRMHCAVRKEIVNVYNPVWKSCLGPNGTPPSGKSWEWVRKRTLILIYRNGKKDDSPLAANDGMSCTILLVWS